MSDDTAKKPIDALVPCMCAWITEDIGRKRGPAKGGHWVICPAFYRPAVESALAEVKTEIERLRGITASYNDQIVKLETHIADDVDAKRVKALEAALAKVPHLIDEGLTPEGLQCLTACEPFHGDHNATICMQLGGRCALASPSEPAGGRKE